jgi:high-affinity iron transporter
VILASIRTESQSQHSVDPIAVAESLLDESLAAAEAKDFNSAEKLALRAYLEGIEPIEPKLKANIPGAVEKIEGAMAKLRSDYSKHASFIEIKNSGKDVQQQLKEIRVLFASNHMSSGIAFGAAFSIFLREGFEAVLIIIVLLSILKAMGQTEATKWVHAGWILALLLGIVSWFASGALLSMSGLSREFLEGSISLFAVLVLIYVGFWLHRYSEMKKWRAFLESKLKHGLNRKSYIALAVVSFMAVFREAFEVVLFLRAIWIDLESEGQKFAAGGVLSSILLLFVLSYFAVRESRKLPLALLFKVCSWTMVVLAIILVGKGIHSLQEAGIAPISNAIVPFRFDLIGFYPSLQTIVGQILIILVFIGLFLSEKKSKTV